MNKLHSVVVSFIEHDSVSAVCIVTPSSVCVYCIERKIRIYVGMASTIENKKEKNMDPVAMLLLCGLYRPQCTIDCS